MLQVQIITWFVYLLKRKKRKGGMPAGPFLDMYQGDEEAFPDLFANQATVI